jgi:ribosome biogenesis protein MAK21
MTEIISNKQGKANRRRGRKSGEKGSSASSADAVVGDHLSESVANYQSHNTPLIRLDGEAPTWHAYGQKLPGRNDSISSDPPNAGDQPNNSLVAKYRSIGDLIYQKELQLTGRKNGTTHGGDDRWVENTMKKGTLKDRIAAMSVTVSTNPVHKFYALDGLLSMVGCSDSGGRTNSRVAQLTAEALEDLFINTFLPPDRKLLTLSQRPLYRYEASKNGKTPSKTTLSPRILLLWRFEEMVKEKYEMYLRKYMALTLQEGVEMHKIATLQSAAGLLKSVPEGESQLLAMMANKLGDPGKKTAAAAGHQLRNVLIKHPNMQIVIAREVQQLAHRPHLSPKALYGCIVFLNQLKLEKEDESQTKPGALSNTKSLPASLIKTYFRLFEVAVKKSKAMNPESEEAGMKSRLLSALL